MRGLLKPMLAVGMLLAVPVAAVAVPISGELNLTGMGGVNFGGGTASMAIFSAMGRGNVATGLQTGSFGILAPCTGCVTFGQPTVPSSGNRQFTYGPGVITAMTPTDTTYSHFGEIPGLPLFALNDAGTMSSFTPMGEITIDQITTTTGTGAKKTTMISYILSAAGTLTLTGFDPTSGTFSITTQGSKTFASFSATADADAAPAPLAGAGLLSFAGAGFVGLRKRGRRLFGRLSSRLAAA